MTAPHRLTLCGALALAAAAVFVALALAPPAAAEEITIESPVFVDGQVIDNPWWPLAPGTTFVYEADTEDGHEHTEVAVLHDTRVIEGVTCTVVLDQVWADGLLAERTHDWYAQDTDGNVWYFGEDTAEYDEDGNVVSTEGSWEAGVDGAEKGIIMLAEPEAGDSYRQEYLEGEAEDQAKVLRTNATASVPFGEFEDCVKIKEWTALERGNVEHKYYAEGVGLVLVEVQKGPTVREELTDILVEP